MDTGRFLKEIESEVIVGFFDLTLYARWSEGRPARDMLEMAAMLFDRSGRAIAEAGGLLIKAIGDAGLFVFPPDDADGAVTALMAMKGDCDAWLSEIGYPGALDVMVQLGPVAFGRVGAPGDKRLDVYGETVNRAALMQRGGFAVGRSLYERLGPDLRAAFVALNADEYVSGD